MCALFILTNFFDMLLPPLKLRSTYVTAMLFLHNFRCTYVTLTLIYRYVTTLYLKLHCYLLIVTYNALVCIKNEGEVLQQEM